MTTRKRDAILRVENLCKRYGPVTAVDSISFAIYRGEVLGFLGPNGAGKSTTIDLITTLQQPSRGHISYPGLTNTNSPHAVRRRIGIVPQELAIYGNLSVRDNLIYTGEMYGLQGQRLQARIEALLAEFGLADKAKARARTLSGGQKRRLNFALADIHEPDLIVLDEPTVGLDPNARALVWEIIQGFREAEKTVLLTTHYMEEAETLCDRIILIDRGRVVAQGAPAELKAALSDDVVLGYQVAGLVSRRLVEELRLRPGVKQASTEGNSLRVVVGRKEAEMTKEWLAGTGLAVTGLHTEDVSLEDVFVHFTGRPLREGEPVISD
jgi:ABC-2 type transport system ATP-binding protein